jgi:UDP-2,4-diacetamido-2,4,6-trideoxy-beta-L-altropyranose hydrolase
MNKTKIIFRADGNSEIGLGHVIRSLALAEMLQKDFECVFAMQNPDAHLRKQIANVCSQVVELPLLLKDDRDFVFELHPYITGKEIIVLDGYAFATEYQKGIKSKGGYLVCIDDIHAYHFVADVIINHSGGIERADYSAEPYTQYYLGPQYALLRPPFLKHGRSGTQDRAVKNILINMGGADPKNATCDVVKEVSRCDFFQSIHVVTGAAYKYHNQLAKIISKDSRIVHHTSINAAEMALLMESCGVCICPPSSVSFEYATINGLLFLKQIADNQTGVKSYFINMGLAFDFDKDFQSIIGADVQEAYYKILPRQTELFDGRSDERLQAIFQELKLRMLLKARPVRESDLITCFEWANDAEVRRSSYNAATITWEDHIKWFDKKLQDPCSNFYIIEYEGKPIGQIRFEGQEEKLISYLIAPEMRGKGLGRMILEKGVTQLLQDSEGVKKISGYVKRSNIASCKAFDKAGFLQNAGAEIPYPDSVKYERII